MAGMAGTGVETDAEDDVDESPFEAVPDADEVATPLESVDAPGVPEAELLDVDTGCGEETAGAVEPAADDCSTEATAGSPPPPQATSVMPRRNATTGVYAFMSMLSRKVAP